MKAEKKSKILFVVPSFSGGGAERVVSVLASSLAEKGIDTHCIVYYQAKNEYPHSEKIQKVYLVDNGEEAYKALGMKQKVKMLRKLINNIKPTYIIPFLPQVGFHVYLATFGKRYKVIQTVRNNPKTDPESSFERLIRNFMIAFSWRSFVQNKDQMAYFPKFLRRKMVIIPNPVADVYLAANHLYRDEVREVIAMGRLSEQKNFDLIIRAAVAVRENHPQIHFSIYGEGALQQDLQKKIEDNHLTDVVKLCGRTTDPAGVLNASDVFVLSSNYEGMPNALMEAMAVGLPCISTDCPTGPSDIITNNVNGMLIPVNDDNELVDAINKYVAYGREIHKIGKRAKEYIRDHYSSDVIADLFLREALLIDNTKN